MILQALKQSGMLNISDSCLPAVQISGQYDALQC